MSIKIRKIKNISLIPAIGVFLLFFAFCSYSYASIKGKVVDAQSGEPIEGVIVAAEWTVTKGFGLTSHPTYKLAETVTDKEGKFYISGVWNPFVNPPTVAIYKYGYAPWRNDYSFPDNKRKKRFRFRKGSVIKLQLLEEGYSNNDSIQSFLPYMDRSHREGDKEVYDLPLFNFEKDQLIPGAYRDREIKRVNRLKRIYGDDYRAGKILTKESLKIIAANMALMDYRELDSAIHKFKKLAIKTATKEIKIESPGGVYTVYVNKAAVSAILENMDRTNKRAGHLFLKLLGMFRDDRIVEVLLKLLDDPSEGVRHSAVYSLGRSGEDRVIPYIIPMMKDTPYVRSQAIESLGMFEDERVFEPLIEALNTESGRYKAIKALGTRKDIRAVEPLIDLLRRDYDERVNFIYWSGLHLKIVESLGLLADERAIDPLIEVLRDKREIRQTRALAAEVLSKKFKSPRGIRAIISIVSNRRERDVLRVHFAHTLFIHKSDPLVRKTLEKLLNDRTISLSTGTRRMIERVLNTTDDAIK